MERISRLSLFLVVFLLVLPVTATGQMSQWIPKIYSNEAEVDIDGIYESFDNKTNGVGLSTRDLYFAERFVLTVTGWVYHPRFFVFQAKVGLGLAEENVTNNLSAVAANAEEGQWKTTPLLEYDLRGVFLQEHPYNLELYAVRTMPYVRGRILPGFATTGENWGAIFRYKERPWAGSLSYDKSKLNIAGSFGTAPQNTTDTQTYRGNVIYFKDWGSISAAYNHTDSTTSFNSLQSGSFTSDNFNLANQV